MAWQVKIGSGALAAAASLGIEDVALDYASRAADSCVLTGSAAVLDPAYGEAVEVWWGGVRRFVGSVGPSTLVGAADRQVLCHGVWHDLERVVYCQRWRISVDGELQWVYSSRAILGQAETGDWPRRQNVGQTVAAVVAYAALRGVAIQLGACSVDMVLPLDEVRDVTCAAAIDRVLRFAPSLCSWFDYSTTPPTLHFGAVSAVGSVPVEDRQLALRHDLVVPGVRLEVETSTDTPSGTLRVLTFQEAGDADALGAVWATVPLSGGKTSRSKTEIDVVTEAIPDPLTNAAWWIARHPRLNGIAEADVSFIQATRGEDPEDYPRVSVNPLSDLDGHSLRGRVETFKATVDIIKRDGDGEILTREHAVELSLDLVTTDATTRNYSRLESSDFEEAETIPADFAAQLYARWSVLYAEGTSTWPLASAWPHPGDSMHETPLQRVSVSASAMTATGTYGPPQHLSASDLAAFLNRLRLRVASRRAQARDDGKDPADAVRDANAVAPAKAAGHADGAPTRMRMVLGESSAAKTIDLNPSDLAEGDVAKARAIDVPDGAGTAARVLAISTEAASVTSALKLLVGSSGDGRTLVVEGAAQALLSLALRVVDVSGTPKLALDIASLYLVDSATGAKRPLSDFFGVVSSAIGIKLTSVIGTDGSTDVVDDLPLKQHSGHLYPTGAWPHA